MDWLETTVRACPFCGYDAAAVPREVVASEFERLAGSWTELLGVESALRERGDGWSALEYACHTRDVLRVFAGRVDALRSGEPIGWWDHEAAVVDERYNEQDPAAVAEELRAAASAIGDATRRVAASEWELAAERRPGEVFSIDALVRFAQHEAFHHHGDALAALR